jgi:alkylation response protein AidB-like acyl-CoA dehydrogenase
MELEVPVEDQELAAGLDALLSKLSSSEKVREAEKTGFDAKLWDNLNSLGIPSIAAESDTDLRQLVGLAEAAGRHLASAPLVETVVARRLLAHCASHAASGLAQRLDDGEVATVAFRVQGERLPLVPAGAVATIVIALVDGRLIATESAPPQGPPPNLGSLPLADRVLDRSTVLLDGEAARLVYAAAVRDWKVLTAAQLVGIGARALELGVEYAKTRVIFDQPVASFQTVAHQLADDATDIDAARLLVLQAAWAADRGLPDSATLASMAFCFTAEKSLSVAGHSLHYHGGYGFTLEYDIQLYYRRARAIPLMLGSIQRELDDLAVALVDGSDAVLPGAVATTGGLDFDLGDDVEAFRAEVAAFLDEHLSPAVREGVRKTGSFHDWTLHAALADRGWIAASWPVEHGGQGRNPLEMMAMREELKKRHAPTEGLGMTLLVARAVREFGSEALRNDVLPRALAGKILMCLGYSEPQGGSDVASARTRAVRDGDDWVINGQKVFTTLAEEAHYVFLLCRTNPDVAKHKGLTMFLVPTSAPGVQIDAIHTLGGERTNQTFYSDVRIPDHFRVGDVDGGWQVILAALAYERSGVGEDKRIYNSVLGALRELGTADDPAVRGTLARLAIDVEATKLLGRRSCWVESTGRVPFIEGSMYKLFSAESKLRFSSAILDILGTEGLRELEDPMAPAHGDLVEDFRHAVILTIYGGASEVQRKILAERHLGLPRTS